MLVFDIAFGRLVFRASWERIAADFNPRRGGLLGFGMMDDAIELLPPAKLCKIAKKHLDLKRLRPDSEPAIQPSLLTEVKQFEKASLAGEYYESFGVNSQNYTQKSAGTSAWIALPHYRVSP